MNMTWDIVYEVKTSVVCLTIIHYMFLLLSGFSYEDLKCLSPIS